MDHIIVANDSSITTFKKDVTSIRNYPIIYKRIEKNIDSEKIKIIYAGNVTKERRAYDMLRICKSLKKEKLNFTFNIYGIINPPSLKNEMINFINENNLNNNIIINGYIGFDKLKDELDNADIGICLFAKNQRFNTVYPTKIFDYMSHNLLIVTEGFPMLQSLNENCIILNNINNSGKLISNVINNKDLRQKYINKCRNLIKLKYNWSNEEKKLLKLYLDIEKK